MRVMVVDDHTLVRQGIERILAAHADIEVAGWASNGAQAVARARQLVPDVILMDVRMPGSSGIEATRAIKRELPGVQVVLLTVSTDDADLVGGIRAGADGYLLKDITSERLLEALRALAQGEVPLSPTAARRIVAELRSATPPRPAAAAGGPRLSERERQVLHLVACGLDNREIADRLVVSEKTVKSHVRHVLGKLHVRNRVQAAALALREGLVSVDQLSSPPRQQEHRVGA
jgi:two-component system NarL family response regulator